MLMLDRLPCPQLIIRFLLRVHEIGFVLEIFVVRGHSVRQQTARIDICCLGVDHCVLGHGLEVCYGEFLATCDLTAALDDKSHDEEDRHDGEPE